MATATQTQQRRKRGLFIILAILAALALLLIAAAAAGYNTGVAWFDAYFDGAVGGGALAAEVDDGDGDADAGAASGCFLGIICADASARANGASGGATANDEGVSTK